jgi:hypothetical protein
MDGKRDGKEPIAQRDKIIGTQKTPAAVECPRIGSTDLDV